nr:glycosyltransferase family 1 protein [Burkholderia cenocepacia]
MAKGQLPTGVDRVGLAYVERYHDNARAVLSDLGFSKILSERDSRRIFDLLLQSPPPSKARIRIQSTFSLLTPVSGTFDRAVLLHTSHNGMEQPRYYQAMKRRGIRSVFMIHDLIPITHAEYCRPGVGAVHRARIHTALRHADGLIMNSQDTLDALTAEAHRASLSLPPTVVARLAPGIAAHDSVPSPIDQPYFVMLGTIEPRKNHWFMLHIWRELVARLGKRAPKLVIIGRRGWECENVIDMLERCESIQDAVIEHSDCSDAQLRAWLQHARALLFPSFAEGYGMPLVEALTLGVPVLASNLRVFHEIARDIPDYLDPFDGPGWFRRILAYTQSGSAERNAQLDRIADFETPTWQMHFRQVDAFINAVSS